MSDQRHKDLEAKEAEEAEYRARLAEFRSHGQASSPHVHKDRVPSVNSGKGKRPQDHDPEAAGKQKSAHGEPNPAAQRQR